jgi:SAM-dependent methyltransferase
VEPEMLSYVKNSLGDPQASKTVSYILAAPDDPKLSPGSVDLIFLCNTYHHLEDRSSYFAKVKPALTPAGRIVIIDFYHDERSGEVNFPRRHLVARDTVVADMTKAGYELAGEHTFLTRQYFLEFTPQ